MKGKLIVLDGVDGSGKGTQTDLLIGALRERGISVKKGDFPMYDTPTGMAVRAYLNGEYGDLDEVDAYQASVFYAMDRFAASKNMRESLEKGDIVISNRFTSSNLIHQSSKIRNKDELDKYLSWITDFEWNVLRVPKPDCVIFLNMHWKIGRELSQKRDGFSDIHQDSETHMKHAYNRACELAVTYGWKEIMCFDVSTMKPRSRDEIHADILMFILGSVLKDDNQKRLCD